MGQSIICLYDYLFVYFSSHSYRKIGLAPFSKKIAIFKGKWKEYFFQSLKE
jgi:hypothetical protein